MNKITLIVLCSFLTSFCMAENNLEQLNKEIREKVAMLHELSAKAQKEKAALNSNIIYEILDLEKSLYLDCVAKSESQDQREGFTNAAHLMKNTLHGILQCQSHLCTQEQINALNTMIDFVVSESHQQELDQLLK